MEKLMKVTSVRLDANIDQWYKTEAQRLGMSVTALIRKILTDHATADIGADGMTAAALGRLHTQMRQLTEEVELVASLEYSHVYTFLLSSLAEHGSDGGVGLEFDKAGMAERNNRAAAARTMTDGLMKEWVKKLTAKKNVRSACIDTMMQTMGQRKEDDSK